MCTVLIITLPVCECLYPCTGGILEYCCKIIKCLLMMMSTCTPIILKKSYPFNTHAVPYSALKKYI